MDRGGTFTDVVGLDPQGRLHTLKLLSSSPDYDDPSIEGVRRMLGADSGSPLSEDLVESIRFGTTVATNAFLEGRGGRCALFITEGFGDLLDIGFQTRPHIFKLCIEKPERLYSDVIEVSERTGPGGEVLKPLDVRGLDAKVRALLNSGLDSAAVVLLHSWKNPEHELELERFLLEAGLKRVFLSHRTMNSINVVTRGQSTVVDAFLSPVMAMYLEGIKGAVGRIPVYFMQGLGVLAGPEEFMGKDAILSGPAGGVVAVAKVTEEAGTAGAIGFDMGGTSTDVSRYEGSFEMVHEQIVAGRELKLDSLNIVTVASGGGSILWFDGERMRVGPRSAGADPGPACYGLGGPATITDANLVTGRIAPEFFPKTFGPERNSALDVEAARKRLEELTAGINRATGTNLSVEEAALGFLRIANEKMALAIKKISVSRGFDVRNYTLLCFGGAGGQHASAVAGMLDMKSIIYHPLGGVFSAYGIGLANPAKRAVRTVLMPFERSVYSSIAGLFEEMEEGLFLNRDRGEHRIKREVDLRPLGADTFITVPYGGYDDTLLEFRKRYKKLFGFEPKSVLLEVVNLRVEAKEETGFFPPSIDGILPAGSSPKRPAKVQRVYYPEGVRELPFYTMGGLSKGEVLKGPAFVADRFSTLLVDPGFEARLHDKGFLVIERVEDGRSHRPVTVKKGADPVLLEVFNNIFSSIASEMGHTLRNTALSVNIKQRLDFSCALFDSKGGLVANAPHIPVHIGSMADTVKALIEDRGCDMRPGDVYLTNNPYRGGSHLPDLTVVEPVFSDKGEIIFFVAARGHHADIGGTTPGSMPPQARHIDEEGVLIDGLLIVRDGLLREEALRGVLAGHRFPARNIDERVFDIRAQIAACAKGKSELEAVIERYGWDTVRDYMYYIQKNAAGAVRRALKRVLDGRDRFEGFFEDRLDDSTVIRVRFLIEGGDGPPDTVRAVLDFTGTGPEHRNDNLNAPLSVTRSAVLYVLRTLIDEEIPLNSGCLEPVEITAPEGTIINPRYPAPVGSGNVETSQRIVDVLLGALDVAGASQGTMNNLLFEVEGGAPYYETIGGGSGATDGCHGASGVQVHMTNTRITDPEVLEVRYPGVLLKRFSMRRGSGGHGLYRGGDGLVREIQFLRPARVSIISERRVYAPYGARGGASGKKGKNILRKHNGGLRDLGHRAFVRLEPGDSIIIETPGGGGFGKR